VTMDELTLFVCHPRSCEHRWDKWVPIMGMCRDCYGQPCYAQPSGKRYTCPRCKGAGEEECGSTLACSACGLTKFDQSQWELD
jgi:hypothetical protein